MTPRRVLDVSGLRPYEVSSGAPLWWGQLFLTFIEGTMFCILIAMYFYIRLGMDVWPPAGVQLPQQWQPAAALILLILSCAGSYISSEGAKQDNRSRILFGLALNLVLAFAAMALRALEWSSWNFSWRTTAYGSVTWGILFLHSLDTVADLGFTVVLLVIIAAGRYGPKQRLGVHVDSLVWYFLVGIWIPIYVTIYWGPYLVGAPR